MAKKKKGKQQNGFKRPKYRKDKKPEQKQANQPNEAGNPQRSSKVEVMVKQKAPTLGIKDGKATIVFKASDTLFFRETRPMETTGEVQSIFPPSAQTMAGAVRTFIGDSQGINWHAFNKDHELTKTIGYGDDLGALSFQGAWLALAGERLYPAPLNIMQSKADNKITRLNISEKTIHCDLGKKVRLPTLSDDAQGSKPLENSWLTKAGMQAVLAGSVPSDKQIKTKSDLIETESRVGIARYNQTRAVVDSMLYQTEHIRPNDQLTIELDAEGLTESLPTSAVVRLGGEGRSANMTLQPKADAGLKQEKMNNAKGIILYLLTPLKYEQKGDDWQPLPAFNKQETDKQTIWTGTLNGIELELHSAVTGKAIRDGGWDLAKHQPRPASSMIPAGSVFYCKVKNGDYGTAQQAIHNSQIGDRAEYGLGHIVTGIW